jgi:hypothetical protein
VTSCERVMISLMNDLQTEFQTRMEHDCLRSQMWWSTSLNLTLKCIGSHTRNHDGKRPSSCRGLGWFAVWSTNRRHLGDDASSAALQPLRRRQLVDAPLSIHALVPCNTDSYADLCGL